MTEERYGGYKNWDTWETANVLLSTESTYKWLMAWKKNFQRKIKAGKFDKEKARYAIRKYIIPVAAGSAMSKRFNELTPDRDIDKKKVNTEEILQLILK